MDFLFVSVRRICMGCNENCDQRRIMTLIDILIMNDDDFAKSGYNKSISLSALRLIIIHEQRTVMSKITKK
jgi:hypothetical protein